MSSSSKRQKIEIFEPPPDVSEDDILQAMQNGQLALQGLMPWSSNYTFLCLITYDDLQLSAVYKPCRGARPLWDFDSDSLCRREVASYKVSRALGRWPAIPPTVLRDGPHGYGSVQQFIITDYDIHYFTLEDDPQFERQFQQFALFDYIINNADRKGGHCLLDEADTIWGIDHGLTFHTDYKLRTVIWKYAGQPIDYELYQQLESFYHNFDPKTEIYQDLQSLLSAREIRRFCQRLETLLQLGKFPSPLGMRDYPYPPV